MKYQSGEISNDFKRIQIQTVEGDNFTENNISYKTSIIFIDNKNLSNKNYNIKEFPKEGQELNNLIIEVKFDDITRHLSIQRIFNNFYIITGIIFLIIGIFLCFFGFYKDICKIIVCIIFGEIITFMILVIILDINIKYLEILFIFIGILIGIILSYFSILYMNFYKIIISLTSGFIFGLFLIDIIFMRFYYQLIFSILIDTTIISSISFIMLVKAIKKYYLFLNAIIGSYILIRGISILLFKSLRYRELQIIIYFMEKREWEYFDKEKNELKLEWEYFWIYDILMVVFTTISIIFYYLHTDYYTKSFQELENSESEENVEESDEKDITDKNIKLNLLK